MWQEYLHTTEVKAIYLLIYILYASGFNFVSVCINNIIIIYIIYNNYTLIMFQLTDIITFIHPSPFYI